MTEYSATLKSVNRILVRESCAVIRDCILDAGRLIARAASYADQAVDCGADAALHDLITQFRDEHERVSDIILELTR